MFWQRALTALVGIPILLGLIYLGGWYLGAAVLLLSILGLREFIRLAAASGLRPNLLIGAIGGGLIVIATAVGGIDFAEIGYLAESALNDQVVLVVVLTGIALLMHQVLSGAPPASIANAGAAMLGVVYVPLLFSYAIRLRAISLEPILLSGTRLVVPSGACWLVLVIFTCWAMDTAAYSVGKTMGRHKLCPTISPGKTIEGSVGAFVFAVIVAAALGRWFGLPITYGALLGVILGVAGQLGDLSKSVMKRQAGVKDSGAVLPGHGGILDRFDSLLFGAPLAFYYLRLLVV